MRFVAPTITLTCALVVYGCTTERGTGPPSPPTEIVATTKLPAMSILDDPIVAISGPIEAGRWPSDTFDVMYGVHLPTDLPAGMERVDDMLVMYKGDTYCTDVAVWNPRDSAWVTLESNYWSFSHCDLTTPRTVHERSLSAVGVHHADFLDATKGDIQFAGTVFSDVQVRLVQYRQDYAARLVLSQPLVHVQALAAAESEVWAVVRYDVPPITDSIVVFDTTGSYLRAFDLGRGRIKGLAYHHNAFWATVAPRWTILRLSSDGEITAEFLSGESHCRGRPQYICYGVDGQLVSGFGRLWAREPERLNGHLTDSSISVGAGIVDWELPIPRQGFGLACDNEYFYQTGRCQNGVSCPSWLRVTNLSSELVFSQYPSIQRITLLAFDGEAFWGVHYGVRDDLGYSRQVFLSRFDFPKDALPEIEP